jgi:hypothetical protein
MTVREIAAVTDNYLTYGGRYAPIDWTTLDTTLEKINAAFFGPMEYLSKYPFVTTGVLSIDSVDFLEAATAPLLDPLNFEREPVAAVPSEYELFQNYPNPFNPATTIAFALREDAVVTLTVYDMLGREVGRLLDSEPMDQGTQDVEFDASGLSTGIYYYVLTIGDLGIRESRRMLLIK